LRRLDSTQKVAGNGTKDPELRISDERRQYGQDGFSVFAKSQMLCASDLNCLCPRGKDCPTNLARFVTLDGDITHDQFGNVVGPKDARGNVTSYTYDLSTGQVLSTVRRVHKPGLLIPYTDSRTYDSAGRIATETNPSGQVTRHFYDALGGRGAPTGPFS
jgi:YD repeat-containing protein